MDNGWIGVDLDGTLARDYPNMGQILQNNPRFVGEPIEPMVERVKAWLAKGIEVRIVTARVSKKDRPEHSIIVEAIKDWCLEHLGQKLTVTASKDWGMRELWDDRAIAVETNTGAYATWRKSIGDE